MGFDPMISTLSRESAENSRVGAVEEQKCLITCPFSRIGGDKFFGAGILMSSVLVARVAPLLSGGQLALIGEKPWRRVICPSCVAGKT